MMITYMLLLGSLCTAQASGPVIKTSSGTFEGTKLTAKSGQFYNAFRGIPYAKPPVGDLRFRSPIAADFVDGLYDATAFKPFCVQMDVLPSKFGPGQEDCLYLNVFTPRTADRDDGDLKKVLVFFHGGANINGFPDVYIPGALVTDHDIIVVTVAYRLGYLGLLSTLTPNCEGNFLLQDQFLSLVWVNKNILDFGGDPSAVTISGESAGAFDTSMLSLVPGSGDLFIRAYCQSGSTGVHNSMLITNPRPEAIKVGRKSGCLATDQADPVTDSDFDVMVDCLRLKPAEVFRLNGTLLEIPYLQPVLYGDLFSKDIDELFSDEDYLNSIKFFDRDYLFGLDQNEGGFLSVLNEYSLTKLSEEVRKTLTPEVMYFNSIKTLMAPIFGPVSQGVIEKVAEYYESSNEYGALADFGADALFHFSTMQYINATAARCSAEDSKVYLFRFVHFPEWMPEPDKGIIHGFDLLYLFDLEIETIIEIVPLKADSSKWNKNDDLLKHKFTNMVVDFIKTGNPGRSLNSELPSKWQGYDRRQQQYLELSLKSEVKHHFLPERIRLWSEQIPKWIEEFPLPNEKHEEL